MKKLFSIITAIVIFLSISGCGNTIKNSTSANLDFSHIEKEYTYSFSNNDSSRPVKVNGNLAEQFNKTISNISLEYEFADLYGVLECYDRIFTKCYVSKHKCSALDNNGKLTAEHLAKIVEQNNKDFYNQENVVKGFYKEADGKFLLSVCKLIVDTITEVNNRYPDIDYDRVYCNLANLKVFYKVGSLDFASVTPDMILQLGDATLNFATILAGGTAIRDVVIHEIMHIIQLGCSCEGIEHCTRRAGITYRWDDVELQGNDWSWFFEGSAELNMSMLTGDEPITYKTMINYLQSVNLATCLNPNIPANYAQIISFYNDPNRLFELFNAKSKEEITEIANLMEAIQIIQYVPDEFKSAYKNKYGIDLSDEDEESRVRYSLKPAICLTFSKAFYQSLTKAITENNMTENDIYFLIRIFEAAMDYHTTYSNEERYEINKLFLEKYKMIRSAFFKFLQKNGLEINESTYEVYEMFTDDNTVINASFLQLEKNKKEFLLERTEFLKEQLDSKIL